MISNRILLTILKTLILLIFFSLLFLVVTSIASCNRKEGLAINPRSNLIDTLNYKPDTCIYQRKKIRKLFKNWEAKEIRLKHFFAEDSCNPSYYEKHEGDNSYNGGWGFPDSTRIEFSFADLNGDGKLNGLVTFVPDQCDGGNASMWTQLQIFFISGKKKYRITDEIDVKEFSGTDFDEKGFYWLDSISKNKICGRYIEFKDSDGHCCPSTNWLVTFDFKARKIISAALK